MARLRTPSRRRTLCTHCDCLLELDTGAKSISCPRCHKRVITEALDVKDYVAVRQFHTANQMRITKKGIVYASVRADDLVVEGVLEGAGFAIGTIRLSAKARVKADLRASRLVVERGATLEGDLRIGPSQVPERESLWPTVP